MAHLLKMPVQISYSNTFMDYIINKKTGIAICLNNPGRQYVRLTTVGGMLADLPTGELLTTNRLTK